MPRAQASTREPAEKKKQDITASLRKILRFDPRLRFVFVINEHGGLGPHQKRGKTELLLGMEDMMRGLMQISLVSMIDKTSDRLFGPTDYLLLKKQKVILAIFPFSDLKVLVASAEPEMPPDRFQELAEFIDSLELDLSGA